VNVRTLQSGWRRGTRTFVAAATIGGIAIGAGISPASASSAPSPNIPISAQITTSSTGPNIECTWLVSDNNLAGGAETSNTSSSAPDYTGAPYTSSPGATAPTPPGGSTTVTDTYGNVLHTAINYSGTTNSVNTGTPSCGLPESPNSSLPNPGAPEQANPSSLGVDILPNAFDAANQNFSQKGNAPRRLELWSAVDDLNGLTYVSDVYWDVYLPDGTLLAELFSAAPIEGTSACTTTTNLNVLTPMFAQAVADGELTSAAVNDTNNGMLALCNEGAKSLWHNAFTLSKDDPNGTYSVVTHAIDTVGAVSTETVSFSVEPFIAFEQDFNAVNWGSMVPGTTKQVSGDTTFDPSTSTTPTLTNGGNTGMQVGVQFFPLTGTTYGKSIGTADSTGNGFFDASFGYNAANLQAITPIPPASGTPGAGNADKVQWFNNSGGQEVCPNDTPKLDLSIHPELGIPVDTYTGTMVVWSQASGATGAGSCPTDEGHAYTPVVADAGTPVRNAS
jgi:hypothetical protein